MPIDPAILDDPVFGETMKLLLALHEFARMSILTYSQKEAKYWKNFDYDGAFMLKKVTSLINEYTHKVGKRPVKIQVARDVYDTMIEEVRPLIASKMNLGKDPGAGTLNKLAGVEIEVDRLLNQGTVILKGEEK